MEQGKWVHRRSREREKEEEEEEDDDGEGEEGEEEEEKGKEGGAKKRDAREEKGREKNKKTRKERNRRRRTMAERAEMADAPPFMHHPEWSKEEGRRYKPILVLLSLVCFNGVMLEVRSCLVQRDKAVLLRRCGLSWAVV